MQSDPPFVPPGVREWESPLWLSLAMHDAHRVIARVCDVPEEAFDVNLNIFP